MVRRYMWNVGCGAGGSGGVGRTVDNYIRHRVRRAGMHEQAGMSWDTRGILWAAKYGLEIFRLPTRGVLLDRGLPAVPRERSRQMLYLDTADC